MIVAVELAFLLCAAQESALIVVPQGDDWAQIAAKQLRLSSEQERAPAKLVQPLERVASLGLMPTYLEDDAGHDSKHTRDVVLQRLAQAREIADPARAESALRDTLQLALSMPAQVPERRNSVVRQVARELLNVLFKKNTADPEIDALLEQLAFRFDFGDIGGLAGNKALNARAQAAMKALLARGGGTLALSSGACPVGVSIDGSDFRPPVAGLRTIALKAGAHELAANTAEGPLWLRRFTASVQGTSVEYDCPLEATIGLTPNGLVLRRGKQLEANVAVRLAQRFGVDRVWLIEHSDPRASRAVLRIFKASDGSVVSSDVTWSASTSEAGKVPSDLIDVAAQVATSQQIPPRLNNYRVEAPTPTHFVITPYAGQWEPPKPWHTKWWVWTIAGAVVAGAVTTAVVLGTRDTGTALYQTSLTPVAQ